MHQIPNPMMRQPQPKYTPAQIKSNFEEFERFSDDDKRKILGELMYQ